MTHPMPEINTLLKQLKLSYMTDYLAQRNRESIEKKLAYPEFLGLLLQDEILGRENKKFQARIKRANVDSNKTLEKYDFDFNSTVNRAQIKNLLHAASLMRGPPF